MVQLLFYCEVCCHHKWCFMHNFYHDTFDKKSCSLSLLWTVVCISGMITGYFVCFLCISNSLLLKYLSKISVVVPSFQWSVKPLVWLSKGASTRIGSHQRWKMEQVKNCSENSNRMFAISLAVITTISKYRIKINKGLLNFFPNNLRPDDAQCWWCRDTRTLAGT